MKKTTTAALRFAVGVSLLGVISAPIMAQNEPNQMHVKITERNGKDSRVIERTYRSDGMTDEKRDALVNRLIDSLQAARKGKGNSSVSVVIEDVRLTPPRPARRSRMVEEGHVLSAPPVPPVALNGPDFDMRFQYYDDSDTSRNRRQLREFRFQRRQLDSMAAVVRRQARELERDLRPMADRLNRTFQNRDWQRDLARPFEGWVGEGGQASTVRGLDVYPNNPDRNLLNVRFNTPAKGDVQIVVTNTKGRELARRELKAFSGEFVGQIDVGRNAAGVFFVTVTQNEDGAVRRVVLRKDEANTK